MNVKMYCTTKTLKYILSIFNLLFVLLGSLSIWFGAWLLNSVDIENGIDHGEYMASIVIITLGCVILVVSVYGTIGIYQGSKGMLIAYAVILIVLLVIQIILVSVSYAVTTDGLSDALKKGYDQLWDVEDNTNITLARYEQWLHCCGKNSAEDYLLFDKFPPSSCCKDSDCTNPNNLYINGCEQTFREYMNAKTSHFNVLSTLLILVEFSASICTCILVDSIRNHLDRRRLYS